MADEPRGRPLPLGAATPEGVRFVGLAPERPHGWRPGDAPTDADLALCVACGLCLPHCPTYRLTGEESASPRGRITAMRSVADGRAELDRTFSRFMDLCLACRACEDVCPSHVPFGRMMEGARAQVEPLRSRGQRFAKWLGLDVVLPRNGLLTLTARFQRLGLAFTSARTRDLVPRATLGNRIPKVTEPEGDARGTVTLLTGCVQDRWFRPVNRSTVRVLARNGWRVLTPRGQTCCGALPAHHGRLATARDLARRNLRAFADADVVVSNAAGCSAQLKEVGHLLDTDELVRRKVDAIASTGVRVIASANPGCTMQIAAGLRAIGYEAEVEHPVELLDRAYVAEREHP